MTEPLGSPEYSEAGRGSPLCCIPGMEGAWQFWEPQLEALSANYRVIACSLPRFPFDPRLRMDDYAREVLRLLDLLSVERAVFVGESFGGMVCQCIALEHPQRVEALVLCNTMPAPQRGGLGINAFTLATMLHSLAFLPGLGEVNRRAILEYVGRHRGFVLDPSPGNGRLCDYLMEHGPAHGAKEYLNRAIAAARTDYRERLERISVPTLVLRGSEDRLVTADTALYFLAKIPRSSLALVEGGGHCCTYTMPDAANRAILRWLEGLGGSGRG